MPWPCILISVCLESRLQPIIRSEEAKREKSEEAISQAQVRSVRRRLLCGERGELTSAGQTQAEIDELRTAIELERNLRAEADLAAFAAARRHSREQMQMHFCVY